MIDVLEPGLQTTVQDSGRPGHLAQGIAPAGAFDSVSYRLGNVLVANPCGPAPLMLGSPGAATLEFVLMGPRLQFRHNTHIAITGAEFAPTVNGDPVPMWQTLSVSAGSVLAIGGARRGARGYLAVRGGIDVEPWLGSRATYVSAGIGGYHGRALRQGDVLQIAESQELPQSMTITSPLQISDTHVLRVMAGPQEEMFTATSVDAFYNCDWQMTASADRMGCRFRGPELELHPRADHVIRDGGSGAADIIADVSPLGAIQVPSGLELIALGIEVPSIGGYAKIATVISADIAVLAQIRPWQVVRFRRVDVQEADTAFARQEEAVRAIRMAD